jgi:nitronate monooxygenase
VRLLARSGIDMVVLQHADAGGHWGSFLDPDRQPTDRPASSVPDLDQLIASVAAETDLPVIAAGGLMDGRDIGRVMAAGAAGAQLGTAFIACPETLASDAYRARLVSSPSTRSTHRISGRTARGLDNALMQALDSVAVAVPDYPLAYDAVKRLIAAVGDPEFAVMWAGAGASRARALPAGELVRRLIDELAAC